MKTARRKHWPARRQMFVETSGAAGVSWFLLAVRQHRHVEGSRIPCQFPVRLAAKKSHPASPGKQPASRLVLNAIANCHSRRTHECPAHASRFRDRIFEENPVHVHRKVAD